MNNQATMEKMQLMKLSGMLRAFQSTMETNVKNNFTSDELIGHLIDAEWDDRQNRKFERLVQYAKFRYKAAFEEIDFQLKRNLDKNEILEKLNRWLKTDYSLVAAELHYAKIKPRIICEKYIETDAGFLPIDYKLFCFHGKVHCTMVCTLRSTGHPVMDFYDRSWEIKLLYDEGSLLSNREIARPKSYEKMIEVAEKLSKPFPFVRIDFYDFNGTAILGEMTFTMAGWAIAAFTDEGQKKLGDLIKLPQKIKS